MTIVKLKALHDHYKSLASVQAELWGPDCQEVKAYDELARAVDIQILDLLVLDQEARVKAATIE